MASFQILDQREEDELHKSRLLNVEERSFKRITKRLLTPGSLVSTPSRLPSPPDDDPAAALAQLAAERAQFRDDVLLDFAAFDSSIARIQFLHTTNAAERARYAADKERILATAQAVKDSTAGLRVQLEDARQTLEQRKKFDRLAEKITGNAALRPREEQEGNLWRLEEECRELERESVAYGETWRERREQFGRIVEEGMQLRRLIRDEKEEVERREGMDGGEEDGEIGEGSRGGQTPSYGTPRMEGQRGGSPTGGLRVNRFAESLSRSGSRSRGASPARSDMRVDEDQTMGDDAAKSEPVVDNMVVEGVTAVGDEVEMETPRVTVDEPAEDGQLPDEEDKMDTN